MPRCPEPMAPPQNAAHHSRCQTCRKLQRRAAPGFFLAAQFHGRPAGAHHDQRQKYGGCPPPKKASTGMAQGNLAVPLCRF